MKTPEDLAQASDFYVQAIQLLAGAEIPFLVGGAYALREYTGVVRDTKDFDVFLRPRDVARALAAFRRAGYRAEIAFSHWLAKVHHGENFIDIIFRAGNGLCEVDNAWFRSPRLHELLGQQVGLVPPEEMIWQKAYIMERERFDGADIAHLLQSCSERIDWEHLLRRFGADGRVLLSHLLLFGFIYPGERQRLPTGLLERLFAEAHVDSPPSEAEGKLCQGSLLSRAQYLADIERWGYRDARTVRGTITATEIGRWTEAIGNDGSPQ